MKNKLYTIFILTISLFLFSFSITKGNNQKGKHCWQKTITYSKDSTIKTITKSKQLRLIDRRTSRTKSYLEISKSYINNKLEKKNFSTKVIGGCIRYQIHEHTYSKRFPKFIIFRLKVFYANFGNKNLLYE